MTQDRFGLELMTPETVPHWLKQLTPPEYAQRRNEEVDSLLWSLSRIDPLIYAAQMLHTIGTLAPEFGSHHHACIVMSDVLAEIAQRRSAPIGDAETQNTPSLAPHDTKEEMR